MEICKNLHIPGCFLLWSNSLSISSVVKFISIVSSENLYLTVLIYNPPPKKCMHFPPPVNCNTLVGVSARFRRGSRGFTHHWGRGNLRRTCAFVSCFCLNVWLFLFDVCVHFWKSEHRESCRLNWKKKSVSTTSPNTPVPTTTATTPSPLQKPSLWDSHVENVM